MHELGTVMYIIRTVEDCCRENQLTRVASVTLQVGGGQRHSAQIPERLLGLGGKAHGVFNGGGAAHRAH